MTANHRTAGGQKRILPARMLERGQELGLEGHRIWGTGILPVRMLERGQDIYRSNVQPIRLVRLIDPINFSFKGAALFESWIASTSITTTPEVSLHGCLFLRGASTGAGRRPLRSHVERD